MLGYNGGKAKLWLLGDASNGSYIQSEHTGGGSASLTFGTSSGSYLPTQKMVIAANGNVSIGTTDVATYKLKVQGSTWFETLNVGNPINVSSLVTNSINGAFGTNGPFVIDPNYTTNSYILMWDDVRIQGNFSVSSGTKSWRIKHPILENKDLIHVCIEAPRADNLYRGRKQLFNGECEVNIDLECNTTGGMTDGTFVLINKNIQVFVNNNETFDRVIGRVVGNKLNIKCENENTDCYIDWLVIGERNDDDMKRCNSASGGSIIIEVERGEQPIRPPRTTCNSSNIDEIEPSEPEGV